MHTDTPQCVVVLFCFGCWCTSTLYGPYDGRLDLSSDTGGPHQELYKVTGMPSQYTPVQYCPQSFTVQQLSLTRLAILNTIKYLSAAKAAPTQQPICGAWFYRQQLGHQAACSDTVVSHLVPNTLLVVCCMFRSRPMLRPCLHVVLLRLA
jgi:hypothetical protein